MKHLPKHLRPTWRYLAVGLESWPDADVDRRSLQRELWTSARALVGDVGSAGLDLRLLGFRFEGGVGEAVIRTYHDAVPEARAAIACLTTVAGTPVGVHVRGVSGTVKSCEEKYLGREPEISGESRVVFEDAERRAIERNGVVDVRIDGAFAGATTLDFE